MPGERSEATHFPLRLVPMFACCLAASAIAGLAVRVAISKTAQADPRAFESIANLGGLRLALIVLLCSMMLWPLAWMYGISRRRPWTPPLTMVLTLLQTAGLMACMVSLGDFRQVPCVIGFAGAMCWLTFLDPRVRRWMEVDRTTPA